MHDNLRKILIILHKFFFSICQLHLFSFYLAHQFLLQIDHIQTILKLIIKKIKKLKF
jgi:hypothetical protein